MRQPAVEVPGPYSRIIQSAADGRVKNLRDWGYSAGPPVPCPQALGSDSCRGRQGIAGTASRGPRERPLAGRPGALGSVLARAGTGGSANRLRSPRVAGVGGRRARRAHAWLGRPRQPLGRRLTDPGHPGRSLDGPGLGRRRAHRAPSRRSALELDPAGGEGNSNSTMTAGPSVGTNRLQKATFSRFLKLDFPRHPRFYIIVHTVLTSIS